jgi:ubiquinone/menaquinone biosynthesis C-methylase UbiE
LEVKKVWYKLSLKNWDKNTWLSSSNYINKFNKFLLENANLNKNSKILDIGCGRGKILGYLSKKLKLETKPIGLDLENHKDKDKRINFKKIEAINFLKRNTISFNLILIKQTIHFLKINQIKNLIYLCKKNLDINGKVIILTLDPHKNEIPTFKFMCKKLSKSLYRDKRIIKLIKKFSLKYKIINFNYKVVIPKKRYLEMIKNKYISTLLNMSSKQINIGIREIESKFKKKIKFNDKLLCLILKK